MLSAQTKASIARHLGIPVQGVNMIGFALGQRYDQHVGQFYWRLNDLQAFEEASLTGLPIASGRIFISPAIGDTVTVVLNGGSPIVYTVQPSDIDTVYHLASNTLYNVAKGVANRVNAQGLGILAAAGPAPNMNYVPSIAPGYAEVAFQQTVPTAFTLAMSATGSTSAAPLTQGVFPTPQSLAKINGTKQMVYGYLPHCDGLEGNISTADVSLWVTKSDVVEMRPDETASREDLYRYWCHRMADYLGIPMFPMGRARRGRGLVV